MSLIGDVLDLAALPDDALPGSALAFARLSLLDWLACGRAGVREPLAGKMRKFAALEAGKGVASLFGGGCAPARMAALVNGATSHALDYDDTHFAHVGHPSVAIFPAALAVAEERGANVGAVVRAFLVGAEASVRIGMALGAAHYNRGFHQTATAGAFGATVAAGRLMGLTRDQMRVALGLCATRASGLKSQFGTMGKPYNAGIAASNGVECATLTALGFTSCDDGLLDRQGFLPTHSDAIDEAAAFRDPPPETFLFEAVKYKLHACCHGTHAMIEALLEARGERGTDAEEVASLQVFTNPRWLSVCDIKRPRTGLEVKFSYAWLAGMALSGIDTARDATYTDLLAGDARLADFASRVTVTGDETLSDMQARCSLTLRNNETLTVTHDLADPIRPEVLEQGLLRKAEALLGETDAAGIQAIALGNAPETAADLGRTIRGGDDA